MALRLFILSLVIIIYACANDKSSTRSKVAIKDGIDNPTTSEDTVAIDSVVDYEQKQLEEPEEHKQVQTITLASHKQTSEVNKPKTISTIAQQQEAARKIQEELASRQPLPNEEENIKGAVFEKVISSKVKKKKQADQTGISQNTVKKKGIKKLAAIEFKEMKMNFDTIAQGDIIDHKFTFVNTGNAPLEIKSASASCGCTQPSFPFIPIEPNEEGHISVRYNSVGKEGFQNPEISIYTNIDEKAITLFMEGFVKLEENTEGKNH